MFLLFPLSCFVRRHSWILIFVLCQVCGSGRVVDASDAPKEEASTSTSSHRPPNFVILFGDNLGYTDIGFLSNNNNNNNNNKQPSRTPHIDHLAAQGLQLEHWNSAAHLCSASRSALLTGRYPVRDGIYPGVFHENAAQGLSNATPTIASLLKQVDGGYATSIVGKWHLGHRPEFLPTRLGFDEWLGIPYHMSGGSLDGHVCYRDINERMWLPLYHNETIVQQPVQLADLADRYATHARAFIQQHAAQPFFLYLPFSHVHQLCAPRDLPEQEYCQWTADPSRITFDDAVQEMDWIVGQVMDALHQANVASQTLVLFTADNGPWVAEQSCSGKKGKFQGRWLMDNVNSSCTACPHDYLPAPPTAEHPYRCSLPESNNGNSNGNSSHYYHQWELTGVPCGHDSGLGSIWESNLRMPAFAWWPGVIKAGRVTRRTVSTLDVLPTLLSLAGGKWDEATVDGVDISNILLQDENEYVLTENDDDDEPIHKSKEDDERVLFFWRDGFADGPLKPPYGRMDVVAVKVGYRKAWFWTKSGHYNDDPHVYHDPPLVFDIENDPAESKPLSVSSEFIERVKRLRQDHMNQVEWGPPLTLEQDDAFLPCADPLRNCRTDSSDSTSTK